MLLQLHQLYRDGYIGRDVWHVEEQSRREYRCIVPTIAVRSGATIVSSWFIILSSCVNTGAVEQTTGADREAAAEK